MLTSTLTWSNPVDQTDPIAIERTTGGPFARLATVAPAATTYLDTTNVAGTTASYRVAYVTPTGLGPYAGPVSKTFPAPVSVVSVISIAPTVSTVSVKKHGRGHR